MLDLPTYFVDPKVKEGTTKDNSLLGISYFHCLMPIKAFFILQRVTMGGFLRATA